MCVFHFCLSLLCVGGTVAPCALWGGGDCVCLCGSWHCCCLVSYCSLCALQHSCRAVLSDLHSVLQHACPCSSCMVWVSILLDVSGLIGASLSSSTHQHSLRVQVMGMLVATRAKSPCHPCWLSPSQGASWCGGMSVAYASQAQCLQSAAQLHVPHAEGFKAYL